MFEIFIAPSGPKLVEGDQKLRVMDAVLRDSFTFTEIVTATGLAKSTVLFNLKKLVEEGMIEEKEGGYVPKALRLVRSMEKDTSTFFDTKKIGDSLGPDTIERFIAAYLVLVTHRYGYDVSPILIDIAKYLARISYDRNPGIKLEDAIAKSIQFFEKANYAEVKLISMMPMTFDITPNFDATEKSYLTFCEMVIRSISEYVSLVTSTSYYVSSLAVNGKCHRITLGFREIEPQYRHGFYHDFEFDKDAKSDFWVYFTGESFEPVVGDIQKNIKTCLEKRRYSSKELSNELGIAQTTLIGYLKKMEEAKLIASEKSGNKSVFYSRSEKVFGWGVPEGSKEEGAKYLEQALDDPDHAFRYFLAFLTVDSKCLGFDISSFMRFMGRRLGEITCKTNEGKSAEEVFRAISANAEKVATAQIAVTSYNPLTFVKVTNYDMEPFIAENQMIMYRTMFSTIAETIMGVKYVVKDETIYGEGNRGYEVSIVPNLR